MNILKPPTLEASLMDVPIALFLVFIISFWSLKLDDLSNLLGKAYDDPLSIVAKMLMADSITIRIWRRITKPVVPHR